MDAGIRQFADKYNLNHQDPHLITKYTQEKMAEMDYATDMKKARIEGETIGETRGIAKGIEKGRIEALKLAIQTNAPVPTLMAMRQQMGISKEQYEKILNEVKHGHSVKAPAKNKSKNDAEL